ncbi:MAG: M20/M25/M40 family metallo-hydrolase [Ruminococcaceae bacterium]|nr:M20/M25/M40 family metallo-hydrolase [Oscillospiraceae bacterium]
MYWLIIPAIILVFLAVILVRTLRFTPPEREEITAAPIQLNEEKIVDDMCAMIRCKTVSNRDESLVDWAEFDKFQSVLAERFPLIHEKATLHKLGRTGLLYHLKGESDASPSVCMSHYDVVPVEESGWTRPAFDAIVEDGVLWGRGTLDTKGTLCGVMEALEQLLAAGYTPKNDLYLSFSGQEEIDGDSCRAIVSYLREQGVTPALVLDEGGAVVDNVFPGVSGQCALIGTAEKGNVSVDLSLLSQGGHASTPPPHTILGQLSQAAVDIENHPFPRHLSRPVAEMFDTLGRHSSFLYRMIFANLWCFEPVLDMICKKSGGELNAMMRTTVAVTRMEGSRAYNVLPPKASMGINIRLMEGDTKESAVAYLRKVIKNDKIDIRVVDGGNPSAVSETSGEGWDTLCRAIRQTWPEALVSPYLMMAGSDSRNYCAISQHVYRFSAMHLSKEERAMIHGHNERVPVKTLLRTVEFYLRLLEML